MADLKKTPLDGTPVPAPALGLPSVRLAGQLSAHADELRAQAQRDRQTAIAARATADEATAEHARLQAAMAEILARLEQVRADMDAAQAKAEEHAGRAQVHQEAAEVALADATYLDGVLARLPRREVLRELTREAVDAGTYGEPALPDPYRAPETVARTDPGAVAAALEGLKRLDTRTSSRQDGSEQ